MLLDSKGKYHRGLNETDALASIVAFLEATSCYHSPQITSSCVAQRLNYVSEIAVQRHFLCIVLNGIILLSQKKPQTKQQMSL